MKTDKGKSAGDDKRPWMGTRKIDTGTSINNIFGGVKRHDSNLRSDSENHT